eukprot:g217.t1
MQDFQAANPGVTPPSSVSASKPPAFGRRAGFLQQLKVLSSKNFKLKRSQTCWCCTCPFVPLCIELLLPVLLCILFGWVSSFFDTSPISAGWTTSAGFSGTEAKNPLTTFYHAPAGYATAGVPVDIPSGPGQGMWARVAPMYEFMDQVTGNGPWLGRSRPQPASVCNKIALVAGGGSVDGARVRAFQMDVHQRFHPEVSWPGGAGKQQAVEMPGFANATIVFESLDDFDSYVTASTYLTARSAKGPECLSCHTFVQGRDTCSPNIAAALVLNSMDAGGAWDFAIRVNATRQGDPNSAAAQLSGNSILNTKGAPNVNVLQRLLVPTAGAAAASLGFMSLQQLMDRYILNTKGPAADTAGAQYDLLYTRVNSGFYPGPSEGYFAIKTGLLPGCLPCKNNNWTANPPACDASTLKRCQGALRGLTLAESYLPETVNLVPLPIENFQFNTFYDTIAPVFALFFQVFMIMSTFLVHAALLTEKETKMREMLRIMGVSNEALMASWYLMFVLIYFIFAVVITYFAKHGLKGALLPNSAFSVELVFFFGFFMSIVSWAYCIVPFFSNARIGSIGGTLLFFAAFYVSSAANLDTTLATKRSMCLLPPVAMAFGIQQFSLFESAGVGVQWSNMATEQENFTFGTSLGMLYLDIFLYAFLGWYFDKVVPQEFGARLPPWFFLLPDYWRGHAMQSDDDPTDALLSSDSLLPTFPEDRFEPVSVELRAQESANRAVVIKDLTKRFSTPVGTITAVNKLSLNMYEGQIFCLLGHNGAGKTTTISMMTGMLTPSSGDATVAGDSIALNMQAVRQHLSMCPQHNVLYPNLSVEDHLMIFGRLKGLSDTDLAQKVTAAIARVGLVEKRNAKTMALSGGMKRKLSVAMALLTNTKFTFLDEPTSGMDPYSRRSTWDTLQNAREGRVLLLTTHFMDEADMLGDRIGIMAEGELRCVGSPLFLKNRFGAGYRLTIVKKESCNDTHVDTLKALVTRNVPAARMATNVGAEVTFQLPIAASAAFPAMLDSLEASKQDGTTQIETFGISVTTMEEVFIKVARGDDGSNADAVNDIQRKLTERKSSLTQSGSVIGAAVPNPVAGVSSESDASVQNDLGSSRKMSFLDAGDDNTAPSRSNLSGFGLLRKHFYGLLMKRVHYGKRDKVAICCNTGCPAVFICFGLAVLVASTVGQDAPPFVLSMDDYNDGTLGVPVFSKDAAASASLVKSLTKGLGTKAAPIAQGVTFESQARPPALSVFPPIATEPNVPNGQYLKYQNGFGAGSVNSQNSNISLAAKCTVPPDQNKFCENINLPQATAKGGSFLINQYPWRNLELPQDLDVDECDQATYTATKQLCERLPAEFRDCSYFQAKAGGGFGVWRNFINCSTSAADGSGPSPLGTDPELIYAALVKMWQDGYSHSTDGTPQYTRANSAFGGFVVPDGDQMPPRDWYVLQNTSSRFAGPIFANLLSNALYGSKTGGKGTIKVTNHPLPLSNQQKQRATRGLSFTASLIIMIAFAFIPSGIAAFVVREREAAHNSKHQQLLSGASIPMYWLSNFAFDYINYLLPFASALILIKAFGFQELIDGGALGAVASLLIMFGFAMIPWTYALTFCFSKHTSAQIFVVILAILSGVILMIAAFVMSLIDSTKDTNSQLLFLYYWFPPFSLGWGLYQIVIGRFLQITTTDAAGNYLPCVYSKSGCPQPGLYDTTVIGYPLLFMGISCIVYYALVVLLDFAHSTPKLRARLRVDPKPPASAMQYEEDDDVAAEGSRVAQEAQAGRTDDVVQIRQLQKVYPPPGGYNIIKWLKNGCSAGNQPPKIAVKKLSFGVSPGECFGFLGINGAGKTSTLKMLTGDYLPSSGTAVIDGHDILTEQLQVRSKLGYCPQFDALLDRLTVREHIELFARIKGVPSENMDELVSASIKELDLTVFEHKLAGRLSGGNKRKLSVAIAMIGSPPIVFLDEPSTGMDPVARRFMWDVIARISTRSKSSAVVLTTHLMEECEALCSRVGIMVGGRLRCLGSVQHLKSKFGRGFMAEVVLEGLDEAGALSLAHDKGLLASQVRVAELPSACASLGDAQRAALINDQNDTAWPVMRELNTTGAVSTQVLASWFATEDRVRDVVAFMIEKFGPDSQLVERQESQLRFRLPGADLTLAEAFKTMESNKQRLNIREYSLSQTTLEQIFNQFAAQQEEETGGARGIVGARTQAALSATAHQAQPAQQLSVTCPENISAGDSISVAGPTGALFTVVVPDGITPGQTFVVTLG